MGLILLYVALCALWFLKNSDLSLKFLGLSIYSDSTYVLKGHQQKWQT